MAFDMDKLQEFLSRFVTDLGATFAAVYEVPTPRIVRDQFVTLSDQNGALMRNEAQTWAHCAMHSLPVGVSRDIGRLVCSAVVREPPGTCGRRGRMWLRTTV